MRLYDYEQPRRRSIAERNDYTANRLIGTSVRVIWKIFKFYIFLILMLGVGLLILAAFSQTSHASDQGQWDTSSQELRQWYKSQMQPDNLAVSCCGPSDSYWTDESYYDNKTKKFYAIITDDRDDKLLERKHIPNGSRIYIPDKKIIDSTKQGGNPTGHGIVFLAKSADYSLEQGEDPLVYCYIPGFGI